MTTGRAGEQDVSDRVVAATDDLARLRDGIEAVGRGEESPAALRERMADYLETHGPVLEAAAIEVAEETRRQALEQLYALRGQLRSMHQAAAEERRRREASTDA